MMKKEILDNFNLMENIMNGKDVKDLNVILEKMDQAEKDRNDMAEDIKFIKENLFNPHEGLWAESKKNTAFRENTTKWRSTIGAGVVGLSIKQIWDLFTGN
ncbi:hypothetical protein H8D04_01255 [bacterium]|nr:hypothetical protein [bacterium]